MMKDKFIIGISILALFVISSCQLVEQDPQLAMQLKAISGGGESTAVPEDPFIYDLRILLSTYGLNLNKYMESSDAGEININYEMLYTDFVEAGGNHRTLSNMFDNYGSINKGGVSWYCEGNGSTCTSTCNSVAPNCGDNLCFCWSRITSYEFAMG